MSEFVLTAENYYTPQADLAYMSCSQYQGFCECEAKQNAKIRGRWKDRPTEAFLVGNFFHSYFESPQAHMDFCAANMEEIYTGTSIKKYNKVRDEVELAVVMGKKPNVDPESFLELKAPFKKAVEMIAVVESDPLMRQFLDMDGENELFMTGDIFGIPWRMKMDKYVPDMRLIIDYKTVANIWETSYDPQTKTRRTFVETYGYLFRAAVYSMIEAQNALGVTFEEAYRQLQSDDLDLANFFLLCVSKQEYPDKQVLRLNNRQEYLYELEKVRNNLIRFAWIKQGRTLPKRCGMCDYCRSTKVLKEVIPYYELIPEYRADKEVDPDAEQDLVKT